MFKKIKALTLISYIITTALIDYIILYIYKPCIICPTKITDNVSLNREFANFCLWTVLV